MVSRKVIFRCKKRFHVGPTCMNGFISLDSTDSSSNMLYSADGVPLSQLRKLHLHNDDQTFMNRVKAQGKNAIIVQYKVRSARYGY
jgi:hypothetical protein